MVMFHSFLYVYQRVNGGFTEKKRSRKMENFTIFLLRGSVTKAVPMAAMVDYNVPVKLPLVYEGIPPFFDKPR